MTVTIETFLVPGVVLPPEDFERCRLYYARRFGCIDIRNGQVGGKHLSQDIWALEGTPIVAPCDGVMRYISTAGAYGNWGKFQSHKTGKGVWIAHCRDRLRLGDFKKDQEIGKVGTTGTQSTGPHCHAELHPVWDDFNSVERIWPELLAAQAGPPTPFPPPSIGDEMRSPTAHGFGEGKAVMFGIAKDRSIYVTVAQDGEDFASPMQLKKEDDDKPGTLHYFLSDRADYLGGGRFQAYAAVESNGIVSVWSPRINVDTGKGGIRRLPGDWSAV